MILSFNRNLFYIVRNLFYFDRRGNFMPFSYDKLWKLALDKKINKTTLRDKAGITSSSLARLSKNENVSMDVLDRICKCLECNIQDIVEHVPEKESIKI